MALGTQSVELNIYKSTDNFNNKLYDEASSIQSHLLDLFETESKQLQIKIPEIFLLFKLVKKKKKILQTVTSQRDWYR